MATAISVCLVVHATIMRSFLQILDTFALNVSIVCINYICRSEGPAQVFFAVAHLAHSCIWKEEEGRLEKSHRFIRQHVPSQ